MFDPASRYATIETATTATVPEGRLVAYVRRRFVPQPEGLALLVEVRVAQGERLDVIAARTLGDPEQFWRICDANRAVRPDDLTAEPGRLLRVPVPQP